MKAALREAAFAAAERGSWEGYTASSLCAAAGVSRSSFYAHYQEAWEPLAEALFESFGREFGAFVSGSTGLDPDSLLAGGKPLSYPFFAHVEAHEKAYAMALLDPRGAGLKSAIEARAAALSEALHAPLRKASASFPDPGYTAAYLAGAMVASAAWWLRQEPRESAAAMAYRFSAMAAPGVLALMGLDETEG